MEYHWSRVVIERKDNRSQITANGTHLLVWGKILLADYKLLILPDVCHKTDSV